MTDTTHRARRRPSRKRTTDPEFRELATVMFVAPVLAAGLWFAFFKLI